MPKTPIDYSKAVIYSIVCKTDETLLYIGSTTEFTKRKNTHKGACCNENSVNHNYPVYVMMRANGGWDSFEMKPIKEFPCENKIQLIIEEERIRVEMKAKLNTIRAYRSPEERKEDMKEWAKENAEHRKKYYTVNAERIVDYKKQYHQENAAKIAEDNKKYYEANAAKIAETGKKYYEANKAKIAEINKKYQKANTAKIAETKKQYYEKNKQQIAEAKKQHYEKNKQQINERRKIKRQELKNAL